MYSGQAIYALDTTVIDLCLCVIKEFGILDPRNDLPALTIAQLYHCQ
jgi:hypothetical protein